MVKIAAAVLLLTVAGYPPLTVVCGFVCQQESAPSTAAAACHGETAAPHAATEAIGSSQGCYHDSPALFALLQAFQVVAGGMPITLTTTATQPYEPSFRDPRAWQYPPGALPAAATRSAVLRI